ncbi:MAG: hypothetical protein WBC04_18395 [Candidatus Acidiferrales bacterium]
MSASATIAPWMPFELADLYLLAPEGAKSTLRRFEWLLEFLMQAPDAATPEETQLLLRSVEVLQEIIEQ